MSGGTSTAQRRTTADRSPFADDRPAPGPVTGAGPAIQLAGTSTNLELGPLPGSAGCARDHARAVLLTWGIHARVIETTQLIVSELVTNAVQATLRLDLIVPAPIRLRLTDHDRHILIEVADADTSAPAPRALAVDAEHGRGLLLVESLSAEWGSFPRGPYGKVVWAMVTRDPPVRHSGSLR